mmetsp:Transcript_29485/g.62586  ORF Transcript_29485/g.62586 Transcript_29485/m.62586 type:complete len:203 (+) Transcript_29485:872-1480(+)
MLLHSQCGPQNVELRAEAERLPNHVHLIQHRTPVDVNISRRGVQHSRHDAHGGRLPGSVVPQKAKDFRVVRLEAQVVHSHDLLTPKALELLPKVHNLELRSAVGKVRRRVEQHRVGLGDLLFPPLFEPVARGEGKVKRQPPSRLVRQNLVHVEEEHEVNEAVSRQVQAQHAARQGSVQDHRLCKGVPVQTQAAVLEPPQDRA